MIDPQPTCSAIGRPVLTANLLSWYADIKRDLPWRDSCDLYGIWVSEIMLQQTTVQTVVPFWQRFMERFPTVQALAAAAETDVLALWSGLGYYSRARNLHAAARVVVHQWEGEMPSSREQWQSLPGIGPYASGAIASIGLLERVPAVDANARRVLARLAVAQPAEFAGLNPAQQQKMIDDLGADWVPADSPGDWNQALMELGALLCGARRAHCPECPVRNHCHAWQGQWVEQVPPPKTPTAAVPVWVGQLLVTWRDRILLVPPASPPVPGSFPGRKTLRADFGKLHPGLWGLPMTPWLAGHQTPPWQSEAWRSWLDLPEKLWPSSAAFRVAGHFRHGITKYRMRVEVLQLDLDPRQEMPARWVESETGSNRIPKAKQGLFFAPRSARPPVSKLTDKGLHFQEDTGV